MVTDLHLGADSTYRQENHFHGATPLFSSCTILGKSIGPYAALQIYAVQRSLLLCSLAGCNLLSEVLHLHQKFAFCLPERPEPGRTEPDGKADVAAFLCDKPTGISGREREKSDCVG
jgi:hypothetical protein